MLGETISDMESYLCNPKLLRQRVVFTVSVPSISTQYHVNEIYIFIKVYRMWKTSFEECLQKI